jgi:hypothetical protein
MLGQPSCAWSGAAIGGWRGDVLPQRCVQFVLICRYHANYASVGIPVFGPTAKAARMEGSKAFAKDFMARNNIPTAAFRTFAAYDLEGAVHYVKNCGHDVVLKASGLAGGKGVLIPANVDEAVKGLQEIMVDKAFGSAGQFLLLSDDSVDDSNVLYLQAMRSWWKTCLLDPRSPCSRSPTATPSCPSPPRRTTSGSARATSAQTRAAWACTRPRRSRRRR